MDREPEELQFMGLLGIYKESFKITFSWRKIFSRITLSHILPLAFIYLAQIQISEFISAKIDRNQDAEGNSNRGTPKFNKIHEQLISEWIAFGIVKAIYLIFLLIFSLLSTSAVVYTLACIYTSKELTFKKVMSVVPIVWKRLMITFLWNFVVIFVYNVLAILLAFFIIVLTIGKDGEGANTTLTLLIIMSIPYIIGLVYMTIVWHLASVISVLEEAYGLAAMIKSKSLIKGKLLVSSFIFVKLQIAFIALLMVFKILVVHGGESLGIGMVSRVSLGVFCLVLLTILIHLALVMQTVIYFVCKSHHHQNIDKSSLAEHLDDYQLGDYMPLIREKDIQLEKLHV